MSKRALQSGNCQCCGRELRVLKSGLIAKHGVLSYRARFEGQCPGQGFPPMQSDLSQMNLFVQSLQAQNDIKDELIDAYHAGSSHPKYIFRAEPVLNGIGPIRRIKWSDTPETERREILDNEAFRLRVQLQIDEDKITSLTELAAVVHNVQVA